MVSIAFSNVKGGCGKTNSIINIAASLSKLNYKVLCIDVDPQHNLSKSFLDKTCENGLMEVLQGNCNIEDVIVTPYKNHETLGNIYLLPCNYNLFFFIEDGKFNKVLTLKNILDKARNENKLNYDFILLDTNPSISLISTSVLLYTNKIIGVLDSSLDSLEGFRYLERTIIKEVKESNMNKELTMFGMILNNMDKRTNFSNTMIDSVRQIYGDILFNQIITSSVKFKESRASRLPLLEYDNKSSSNEQIMNLTKEIIERLGM